MGLIGKILGLGRSVDNIGHAVERVAEVFVPNRTKSERYLYQHRQASLEQLAAEFKMPLNGRFDSLVNGLNRLPRPTLALGTVALFIYAMQDPIGFSIRMQSLDTVPDPLWWLLGAIVSFYFGARELHYKRLGKHKYADNDLSSILVKQQDNAAIDAWEHSRYNK